MLDSLLSESKGLKDHTVRAVLALRLCLGDGASFWGSVRSSDGSGDDGCHKGNDGDCKSHDLCRTGFENNC
jgi:hypothetical protein